MPGKKRKSGKGDGSYAMPKPAKPKPMAAKGNPMNVPSGMKKHMRKVHGGY